MSGRLDDYQWVKRHVTELRDLGSICRKQFPEMTNEFGPWTALKLSALKNYIGIYTKNLGDKRLRRLGFSGRAYLDVFAGTGVNLIGDSKTPLAGSSPIATRFHYEKWPFDRFYALELEEDYCEALQARMAALVDPKKVSVMSGPADDRLKEVLDDLDDRKLHYLAFVDYEGVKGFSWNSLQKLLERKGDIWMTLICPGMARVLGRARTSEGDFSTLETMFGRDTVHKSWEDFSLLEKGFLEKISKYKPIVREIKVRSGHGYFYQLVFATRETQGGSGYVDGVERLKKRIESVSGQFVEWTLEVLEGKRCDLDQFT